MVKKTSLLVWILAFVCIVISIIGANLSLSDLKNPQNKLQVFTGKILSYDYNQHTKYANYYFQVNVNGELVDLEISDLYVAKFKREEFEKTYLPENIYTFVVLQEDSCEYEIIPVVGIKNGSAILLDENLVIDIISFNSKLGVIISALFFIAGFLIVIFKCISLARGRIS